MLSVYIPKGTSLERLPVDAGSIPPNAVWIDLVSPTAPDDKAVESYVGVWVAAAMLAEVEPFALFGAPVIRGKPLRTRAEGSRPKRRPSGAAPVKRTPP